MNPIFAVALLAVTMVAGQDHGSGNCCAPQPISIQLSCNGGNRQPPPPPPPPPPHFHPTPAPPAGGDVSDMCEFNNDGYPMSNPPGGFPPGFRVFLTEDGWPGAHTDDPDQYPLIPRNWDGNWDHLGFEMPQPGTPHYNMLMCIPLPIATI